MTMIWIILFGHFVIGLQPADTTMVYLDCEEPPQVANTKVDLSVDENDDTVTAKYTCDPGYTMVDDSQTELFCDLDTDEWHGNLPKCKGDFETDNNDITGAERRRKAKKLQNILEDTSIDAEFAKQLDLSCLLGNPVRAPNIDNAHILKYSRRKFGNHVFLVVFYECEDEYEMDSTENDRLYCSRQNWIGIRPKCIYINEEYDVEEDDDVNKSIDDYDTEDSNNNINYRKNINEVENEQKINEKNGKKDDNYRERDQKKEGKQNNESNNETGLKRTKNDKNDIVEGDKSVFNSRNMLTYTGMHDNQTEVRVTACKADNGGCDHECRITENSDENRINCSCYSGFILDSLDGRTCHDIDECKQENGGCEEICVNKPGSFECACRTGLQIDTTNGKKCIDANECDDPNIAEQCLHGCENTIGSYRCITVPVTPTNELFTNKPQVNITSLSTVSSGSNDVTMACGDGLMLNDENQCIDIDECVVIDHPATGCQFCKNVYAGFECFCPTGYELRDDGQTCQDIDECNSSSEEFDSDNDLDITYENNGDGIEKPSNKEPLCSHHCVNTIGSYYCRCADHFHLKDDRQTCVRDYCHDLENGNVNKTKCSHECFDDKDGFMCRCRTGFQLAPDLKTCIDINECDNLSTRCSPGVCVNVPGSFICECPIGYVEKARRCHDVDECELGIHKCSHQCRNKEGSYECLCPSGYELSTDFQICNDIDECQTKSGVCGEMLCENIVGSFKCICPEGTQLNEYGTGCKTNNPCHLSALNGGCSHMCHLASDNQPMCQCPEGMQLDDDQKTCIQQLNHCEQNNGGCLHLCNPIDFSCYCHSGYRLGIDRISCIDVNECENNVLACRADSEYCVNTDGGFYCGCRVGYELVNGTCEDLNECDSETHCDHFCVNTMGSFYCACRNGFQWDDHEKKCSDLNECMMNNGNCTDICINLVGSYQCSCPGGQYLVNDEKTCQFVNECELHNGGCSYDCWFDGHRAICKCPFGYQLSATNDKICTDINECLTDNGNCSFGCENYEGYFQCTCDNGYELASDQRSCVDIDECITNNGNCTNNCENFPGSFRCNCETGFELLQVDNSTCTDIDECNDGMYRCSHQCINIPGTYKCTCPIGYKLNTDQHNCEDINECNDLLQECSGHCVNTNGSFYCSCPEGFNLLSDNRTCVDVNECMQHARLLNGGCSHMCENTHGSYRCRCAKGYYLDHDQLTCRDYDECSDNNGGCSHYCINLNGTYRCDCPDEHILYSDGMQCISMNSCSHKNGGCDHKCYMNVDRIQCSCSNGFRLSHNDNKTCIDTDECHTAGDHDCQQECINVIGSYRCRCYEGYRMNDRQQCVDIDECVLNADICPKNSKCINLAGSFRCTCPPGFKYTYNKSKCIEIKDFCQPIPSPKNGDIRCLKSRHRTQNFYKTKCSFICNKGFELLGPTVKMCNGTGQWDSAEMPTCSPRACARLPRPNHGTITPVHCMIGHTFPGERCLLHCEPGFRPVGRKISVCDQHRNWIPTGNLDCVSEFVPSLSAEHVVKPYIKCPQNTTIILPAKQKTVYIKFEQPETNVNWQKYVDSHPAWGKKLEAHLAVGVHIVTFRARSPTGINLEDICRTVVTVKESHPPTVVYCPNSTDIYLQPNEASQQIYWKEPKFHSIHHIKNVFRSKIPGDSFYAGDHHIKYVATDETHQSAICEFTVSVKTYRYYDRKILQHEYHSNLSFVAQTLPTVALATSAPSLSQLYRLNYPFIPAQSHHDELTTFKHRPLHHPRHYQHESYLMCPGKAAIKLETNFPLQLPRGCVIKRLPHFSHIRRRQSFSFDNRLKHYSSWDTKPRMASSMPVIQKEHR